MSIRWHHSPNGYLTGTSTRYHRAQYSFRIHPGINSTFVITPAYLEIVEKKPNGKVGEVLYRCQMGRTWRARYIVKNLLDLADCDEWFFNAVTSLKEPEWPEQPDGTKYGGRIFSYPY